MRFNELTKGNRQLITNQLQKQSAEIESDYFDMDQHYCRLLLYM